MAATNGNLAVSGASIFITGEDGNTYRYDGTVEGSPIATAIPGSIWVDPASNKFYYIDASKYKRYVTLKSLGTKAGAIVGSVWISSKYLNWIGSSNTAYQGHGDYSDYGYSNSGYSDYSDYRPHADGTVYSDQPPHADGGYGDGGYAHNNYSNVAGYSDSGYSDSGYYDYSDHGDTPVKV